VRPADFGACSDYAAGIERARQVACPALVVIGRHDTMTPPRAARDLIAAIPHAKTVQLDDCGHNSMAEKPDEVLDALVEFLDAA
jgi:pimeloyl-ACP methyl ester carboxylesterase